ncbi:TIR domain-containing protein [Candidatus Nitrotoga sp. BS]|uniref:toll/interleukin-1 receptor domain-containing protein n=1 Tax=Candidatus Nitrotoga sp. BS TaxID=2890408 RepID=UPI001EF2EC28|nr:toll/interleukin-1 receptor domain-containing protein [Candidatus Nitrotoga sp. BS]CAH1198643.1 TIR domain-containing protein [Candidatus Nitrotoga sp. BS]
MTLPYVFISYARADRPFVDRLSAELQLAGVKTWVDTQDISPGENWDKEIEKGLFEAGLLLHVASEHSGSSEWLSAELEGFLRSKGRAIPLIIDDAGPSALPEALKRVQWVDFRASFEQGLAILLKGIGALRSDQPVQPKAAKSKGYAFISYSTDDSRFVKELKVFLTERGYSFWDFHTSKRNYQVDFTLELEERIQNAEATLCVISPDWKKSKTALQEMHFSYEMNKPVFLLRVRNPGPTLAISGRTFIDFSKNREDGFVRLAEEMQDVGL